jgi:hypothetical protein
MALPAIGSNAIFQETGYFQISAISRPQERNPILFQASI